MQKPIFTLPGDDYIDVRSVPETEAAAILGCAVQTLRNWRWRGNGVRAIKVGQRMVRYHRADLAAFNPCSRMCATRMVCTQVSSSWSIIRTPIARASWISMPRGHGCATAPQIADAHVTTK